MDQKEYKNTLDRAVRLAHEGKNHLSEEEYKRLFEPLNLTEDQDRLTRDYLKELLEVEWLLIWLINIWVFLRR